MKTQHTCFEVLVLFMQLELRYSEAMYNYYPAVIVKQILSILMNR